MLEKNIQDLENLKTQARQRKSIFLFCNLAEHGLRNNLVDSSFLDQTKLID